MARILTSDLPDEDWLLQGSWDAGATGTDGLHPHVDLLTRAKVLDLVAGGEKRLLVHSCPIRTWNKPSKALQMRHGQMDAHPPDSKIKPQEVKQRSNPWKVGKGWKVVPWKGTSRKIHVIRFGAPGLPTLPRSVGYQLAGGQLLCRRQFARR